MKIPDRLVRSSVGWLIGGFANDLREEALGRSGVVTLDFSGHSFADPAGVAALASVCLHERRTKKTKFEFVGWDPGCYLGRMKLKPLLGAKDDYPSRRWSGGDRFTEITEVATPAERVEAADHVCDVLGIDDDDARAVLQYSMEEVLRNVDDHAESPTNALVHAQYFAAKDEVIVAVADSGRGVLKSLRERHNGLETHEQALLLALEPGVSGRNTRKGSNAGMGLTTTAEMMRLAGGSLEVVSGDAMLKVSRSGTNSTTDVGPWRGVLATVCIIRDKGNWGRVHERALDGQSRIGRRRK